MDGIIIFEKLVTLFTDIYQMKGNIILITFNMIWKFSFLPKMYLKIILIPLLYN